MKAPEFHKTRRLPPYVFAEVNKMKAAARAAKRDIIDLGMGNPDTPTPRHIVDKLVETVQDGRTHRYSQSKGIPGLRRALAKYYQRRFGVQLDPESEVCVTLGSKEGLANLAQAITAPGDTILCPNPSYPIHAFGFIIAGASIRHVPFTSGTDLIRAFARASEHSVPPPTAMILNFPSNPTAEVCDLDFYKEAVAFAKSRDMFILSDIAYSEIYFDAPPPSILQVEGGFDVAIEFSSMSKTYSMPGWRIGFAAGNKRLVGALAQVKSYLDYGAFTPIQVAAAAALNGPQDCVEELRQLYRERREILVDGLNKAGWAVPRPPATMFCWAPIPPRFAHLGSLGFSKLLLEEADVAVAPGLGFGEYGDGHVRLALVENKHRLRQAVRNIRGFLAKHGEPAALRDLDAA
ncbi:alanine-synthesizing transaminase [Arboricoccus pini]|uniref:Aminotransferase n=1 Tax=Arboricoccus pini TaxID=1963835 RepID=A0A212QUN8_9PROT|nr:LL-diaminopimelate aminotransferase [Arboricoccus pini]SNB63428.1 alanine-synthesizing transaminase [Arboricoccus pini]